MIRGLQVNQKDNVAVVLGSVSKGDIVKIGALEIVSNDDIPMPHKIAIANVKKNEPVYKYGEIIGFATQDIAIGDYVHIHNIDAENIMR